MSEWKEYINVNNLTLLVAFITLLVAFATLIVTIRAFKYTRNRDKKHLKSVLKSKRAQLAAKKEAQRIGFDVAERGSLNGDISALEADIKQLEEEL